MPNLFLLAQGLKKVMWVEGRGSFMRKFCINIYIKTWRDTNERPVAYLDSRDILSFENVAKHLKAW